VIVVKPFLKFLKRLAFTFVALLVGFIVLCFIVGVTKSDRAALTQGQPNAQTPEQRKRAKQRAVKMAEIEAATQRAEVAARKADAEEELAARKVEVTKAKQQDEYLLFVRYSQKFVKERLKAPSTAKFPGEILELYEYKLQKLPDGSRRLFSWVDAQNSFGAMIRSKWMVEFRPVTNGWEAVDVIIE